MENILDLFTHQSFPCSSGGKVKFCVAYTITHIKTGRIYVGSTSDAYGRENEHKCALRRGVHKNNPLQIAYNDDSRIEFSFWITNTMDEALDAEQDILNKYFSTGLLFNLASDARCSGRGMRRSLKCREKLRNVHLGRKFTQTHKENLSKTHIGKGLGRKLHPDTIAKMRVARIGKIPTSKQIEILKTANAKQLKPVSIAGITYESVSAAEKALGVTRQTIRRRINNQIVFKDWQYNIF